MKNALISFLLAAIFGASAGLAQTFTGGAPGMDAAINKLFGKHNAFTARLDGSLSRAPQTEPMTMEMTFSFLDGKTRFEMEMSTVKGGPMTPKTAATLKRMGMDKLVVISRPDQKMTLMIYPELVAYAEIAMDEAEVAAADKEYTLETTTIGKETIDGHACLKNKVIMTDRKGKKREAMAWIAPDLEDFPLQIQTGVEGNRSLTHFKDIKFEKPEAKLFEAPAQLTRYTNVQMMIQGAAVKRMGEAGAVKQSPSSPP